MKIRDELMKILLLTFLTSLLVAFLWQAPGILAFILVFPLILAFYFWPDGSTILSYIVAALVGFIFTQWSLVESVALNPNSVWIPLAWGPAGVIVRRFEEMVLKLWKN